MKGSLSWISVKKGLTGREWTGELPEYFGDAKTMRSYSELYFPLRYNAFPLSLLFPSRSLKRVLATDAELMQSNGPVRFGARG